MENTKPGFGKKFMDVVKGNPIAVLLVLAAVIVGFRVDNFASWASSLRALTFLQVVRSVLQPALPVFSASAEIILAVSGKAFRR